MAKNNKEKPEGIVYLVGAGPGDPDLITMKGARLIAECDVVLYDYLAPPEILELVNRAAEKIYVGKQGGQHTLPQEKINSLLVERAKLGKKVVRLKGGDPLIFGRGGEEAEVLAEAGVRFEFVPGVSSAFAAPAYAGIPLTHRRFTSSVTIITGHEDPTKPFSAINWEQVASGDNTLVILMGMRNLRENMARLVAAGLDPATPIAIVRWGTRPNQQTLTATVSTVADEADRVKFKAPAVIVVGRVVEFREKLKWFEKRPLLGKRILVTRAREQAGQLSSRLRDAGAEVFETPTIEIAGQIEHPAVTSAIAHIADFDWVIVTSANGVKYLLEALDAAGLDARALGGKKLAAIGPATAQALRDHGFKADVVPEEFRAEGLIEALGGENITGRKILIARAEEAREILPEELRRMGADVTVAPIYATRIPMEIMTALKNLFEHKKPDMITFASSSTVKNFIKIADTLNLDGIDIASIGPITSDTARELGLKVVVQPAEYTIPALVEAIIEHLSKVSS